jgi:alpha-galactosidase
MVGLPLLVAGIAVDAATIKTADTTLNVEVSGAGLQVTSLSGPKGAGAGEWVPAAPQAGMMPFVQSAVVGGKPLPLQWRLAREADLQAPSVGHGFVFACSEPDLELSSLWKGTSGAGPVEHELSITNHGTQEVQLPLQTTLAFDSTAAPAGHVLENWWVEKGAGTPGAVGVHVTPVGAGFSQMLDSSAYAGDGGREPIPWMAIHDPQARRGWYLGIESSAQVRIALKREPLQQGSALHVEAGLRPEEGYLTRLAPGETLRIPTVFVGCYQGEVDDGGNQLRRWLKGNICPPIRDQRYPLLTNNSWGSGMAVDERLSRTMIDESADLGLEMFHIDAGWFRGVGEWFAEAGKFPKGLAPVADYAHAKGLKFGLWVGWTQGGNQRDQAGPERALSVFNSQRKGWFPRDMAANWKSGDFTGETVCLASPPAEQWCLEALRRMVKEYKLDMLEHDQRMIVDSCSRTDHRHTASRTDVAARATEGYYRIYDTLRRENPELLFEDCVNGGRMVDFGVLRRVDYISITDTYDPLSNRRAFHDASFVLPPGQCECYIENHPGKSLGNFVYMLRSGMMGWCTIMTDTSKWTPEQRAAAKRQFALYKSALRPLIRQGDLYHVSDRPDGVRWDGIEYWDETTGTGALFVFRGTTQETEHRFVLKGLRADARYKLTSEDGSVPSAEFSGKALAEGGVSVHLGEAESSDIILVQRQGGSQ